MSEHDYDEDYAGPAMLVLHDRELPVRVRLVAVSQPVDGKVHWSGRIDADDAVHAALEGSSADAELVTPQGRATGKVGDPDPWGRYRVTGVGAPPYAVEPVALDD